MSHNLDIKNGEARMAYAGEHPWHRLGVQVPQGDNDLDTMLAVAQADFDVRLGQVIACGPDGEPLTRKDGSYVYVKNSRATYRVDKDGSMDGLATVGTRYTVTQNREVMEQALAICGAAEVILADNGGIGAIYDGGQPIIETIGVLDEGRRFFASIRLDDLVFDMPNGAREKIGRYLGVYDSKDGKIPVTFANNDVRWVCQNTVNLGLRSALKTFKTRHTARGFMLEDAQYALNMTTKWARAFQAEAQKLGSIQVSDYWRDKVIADVFPLDKDATDRQKRNHDTIVTSVNNIYASDRNAGGFGATGWSLYNSVVEFLDHHRDGTATERAETSMNDGSWVAKKKLAAQARILALAN